MRHSTITDNGTLVSLDDPKKRVAELEAANERLQTMARGIVAEFVPLRYKGEAHKAITAAKVEEMNG